MIKDHLKEKNRQSGNLNVSYDQNLLRISFFWLKKGLFFGHFLKNSCSENPLIFAPISFTKNPITFFL